MVSSTLSWSGADSCGRSVSPYRHLFTPQDGSQTGPSTKRALTRDDEPGPPLTRTIDGDPIFHFLVAVPSHGVSLVPVPCLCDLATTGPPPPSIKPTSRAGRHLGMKRRTLSAAENTRRTVLFVGSDPHCRIVLSHVVHRFDDVDLRVADTQRGGRELVTSPAPDLVLIDDGWLRGDASAVINPLKRGSGRALIPVAVLSGDESERIRLIRGGALSLIAKPLRLAEVERSITTLLDLFSTPSSRWVGEVSGVVEREISSIVWHSPDRSIEIIYASGERDRLTAAPEVARAFADDVGLPLAASTKEAVRWQRR